MDVILYIGEEKFETKMSCYRANTRGDERFWIYGRQFKENFHSGDLMYISVDSSSSRVIIINVSRGILSDKDLAKIFGQDKIKEGTF